jgi:TRAP-type C4-dicarboxylate transport system permease small subunit
VTRSRIIAGVLLAAAAVCLVLIWLMWAVAIADNRDSPPGVDGPMYALLSALEFSCGFAVVAGVLVALAIRRLRRK